jgi:hypothetical protein
MERKNMAKWNVTRLTADAAQKMQVNAGLLLNNFDIQNPVAPKDEDIICDTTGDYSITCAPTVTDFFEDVNNAPTNTKEGKRITGWSGGLSVTALSVTEETICLSLGAFEETEDGGFRPRSQYLAEDFKKLYWIGEMIDETKLFVVAMDDTVSTGGLSFTATDNGKGKLALTLTPHASAAKPTVMPMAFYLLKKADAE